MELEEKIKKLPFMILNSSDVYSQYERWNALALQAVKEKNAPYLLSMLFEKIGASLPQRVCERIIPLVKEESTTRSFESLTEVATRSEIFVSKNSYFKLGHLRILRELAALEIASLLHLEKYLPVLKPSLQKSLPITRSHTEYAWVLLDPEESMPMLSSLASNKHPFVSQYKSHIYPKGVKIDQAVGCLQERVPNTLTENYHEEPDIHVAWISGKLDLRALFEFTIFSIVLATGDQAIKDVKNSNIVFQKTKDYKLIPYAIDCEDLPSPYVDLSEVNVPMYPCAYCTGLTAFPAIFSPLPLDLIMEMKEKVLNCTEDISAYESVYRRKVCELLPSIDNHYKIEGGEKVKEIVSYPIPMTYHQYSDEGKKLQRVYSIEQEQALRKRIERLRAFFVDRVPKLIKREEPISCFDMIISVFPDYEKDWELLSRQSISPFKKSRLIGAHDSKHIMLVGNYRQEEATIPS